MTLVILVIVLAVAWAAETASFTLPNLILGAAFAFAALWLVRDRFAPGQSFKRVASILSLTRLFRERPRHEESHQWS